MPCHTYHHICGKGQHLAGGTLRVWNANVPNEGIEVIQWGTSSLVVVLPTRVLYSTHSWYCRVPSSDLVSGSLGLWVSGSLGLWGLLHSSGYTARLFWSSDGDPKGFRIRVPGIQSVILRIPSFVSRGVVQDRCGRGEKRWKRTDWRTGNAQSGSC
jgi:hypothetical protein